MPDVMPQLEIHDPDQGHLYDREADADPQLGGRRTVADWGADDLFHHTPRRRRSQQSIAARERRLSGPAGREGSVSHMEAVNREAMVRRLQHQSSDPGAAGAIITRIEDAPSYIADAPVSVEQAEHAFAEVSTAAPDSRADADAHAGDTQTVREAGGRRTVQITGRPEPLPTRSGERRRPARTVEERIGARPDRVAAWAVGLGMLLIFLAVGTADAAPL